MFHTTHCEILGDLLPQNVTIQHTLHAEPVLSFILRTFEDRPDLDLPSGNSSNQSSSQGSIPATSSARTARSSSNSFNPRYQAQATSNSCYHDSCGFSSAPRFALWDQQSCSRALAQEQAQLQVLQASTPNYASGVENIAVARATEDDTDIATAQIVGVQCPELLVIRENHVDDTDFISPFQFCPVLAPCLVTVGIVAQVHKVIVN